MLARMDIVSINCPHTPATYHLLSARRLKLMKREAIIVNTARGGIVDESALAAALRDGRLAGAALDVFAQEPLKSGSGLAGAPNLILTPHVAGITLESNERVSSLVAERVAAHLRS